MRFVETMQMSSRSQSIIQPLGRELKTLTQCDYKKNNIFFLTTKGKGFHFYSQKYIDVNISTNVYMKFNLKISASVKFIRKFTSESDLRSHIILPVPEVILRDNETVFFWSSSLLLERVTN